MEIPLGFYSHNEKNKSQGDYTLFIKHSPDGKLTFLLICVNDMIVTSDDQIEKLTLKEKLATQFEMKELGKLKYFLGIEVAYSKQESMYLISSKKQENWNARPQGYLLSRTIGLGVRKSPIIEKSQYQRLVGKLIYLSQIRPAIAYIVSMVSQFMHDPKERHLQIVERILQYLKESLVSRPKSGRGKRRYIVHENIYICKLCRIDCGQKIHLHILYVSGRKSSNVEEQEANIWLLNLIILDYLKVKYKGPIKLFCDNNSTISIVYNPIQHDRTKHIEIDRHFIKEKLDNRLIVITHFPTGFQLVDVFTKGLNVIRFQELIGKLGMIDIHLST
ncbi:Copia protein, partial [Mucuna pruriens]